jgi:hypothetical protein
MLAVKFRKFLFSTIGCMYGVSRNTASLFRSISLRDYLYDLLKQNSSPFLLSVVCRPRFYSGLFYKLEVLLCPRCVVYHIIALDLYLTPCLQILFGFSAMNVGFIVFVF